jgi:hypothetical protein
MMLMAIARFQQRLHSSIEQDDVSMRTKLRRIVLGMVHEPGVAVPRILQDVSMLLSADQRAELVQSWQACFMIVRHIFEEGVRRRELKPHNSLMATYVLLHLSSLLPRPDNAQMLSLLSMSRDEYIDALLGMFLDGLSTEQG